MVNYRINLHSGSRGSWCCSRQGPKCYVVQTTRLCAPGKEESPPPLIAAALAATETAAQIPLPLEHVKEPPAPMHRETQGFQGPLDFPKIADWLKGCEDNLERGRDGHEYSSLSLVFALNGCT